MNEENIKILEQYIKSSFRLTLPENVLQAIENLINRNKELEEFIIKYYDEIRKEYEGLINHKLIDYIPKSKIKEKIEELDKEEKRELKGTKGQDRYFIKQIYQYKRKVLEELLQEGENNANI